MQVVIEETDRDIVYIEDVVHVHFQVDNWVTISFDGKEDQHVRVSHLIAVSVVP